MPTILVFSLLTLLTLGVFRPAEAQQARNIPLIGYLAGSGSSPNKAFVQGMRDLGYLEDKDVAFAFRTTMGRSESYADLAAELLSLKVDVIVADGTSASLAAKKATSTTPIVMTTSTDLLETGLLLVSPDPEETSLG